MALGGAGAGEGVAVRVVVDRSDGLIDAAAAGEGAEQHAARKQE